MPRSPRRLIFSITRNGRRTRQAPLRRGEAFILTAEGIATRDSIDLRGRENRRIPVGLRQPNIDPRDQINQCCTSSCRGRGGPRGRDATGAATTVVLRGYDSMVETGTVGTALELPSPRPVNALVPATGVAQADSQQSTRLASGVRAGSSFSRRQQHVSASRHSSATRAHACVGRTAVRASSSASNLDKVRRYHARRGDRQARSPASTAVAPAIIGAVAHQPEPRASSER